MGCIVSKSTNVARGFESDSNKFHESTTEFGESEKNDEKNFNTINSKSEEILIEKQIESDINQSNDQVFSVSELNDETSDFNNSNGKISPPNGNSKTQQSKDKSITGGEAEEVINNSPRNEKRKFRGIFVGQRLLCKDEFFSKYTNEKMYRWRQADVANVDGDDNGKALIHFVGWAESFDQWIDVSTEWYKIAPLGLLSKAQCDKGIDLDENEIKAVKYFLLYGTDSSSTHHSNHNRLITNREASDTASIVRSYTVGQYVDVQDIYQKKDGKQLYYKWRKAQLVDVSGASVRIHYIDWDSKYDETIDTTTNWRRIREYNSMTGENNAGMSSKVAIETSQRRRSYDQSTKNLSRNGSNYFTSDETLSEKDEYAHQYHHSNHHSNHSSSNHRQHSDNINRPQNTNHSSTKHRSSSQPRGSSIRRRSTPNEYEYVQNNNPYALSERSQNGNTPSASPSAVYVSVPIAADIMQMEKLFVERLKRRGFRIVQIEGDGNCLFRAVSHQLYLREDRHEELRAKCVRHMMAHRKRFEMFCDESFDDHVQEMRLLGTWGDDLEIRALEEIVDRIICIYSSHMENVDEPTNKNFEEDTLLGNVAPINLAYHGQSHFNSLCDERRPPPLEMRHSRVLLDNRIALFEEFLISSSLKCSEKIEDSAVVTQEPNNITHQLVRNGNGHEKSPSNSSKNEVSSIVSLQPSQESKSIKSNVSKGNKSNSNNTKKYKLVGE
mmetsp:Transcript_25760/g.35393  ORF Transcript_25760/g.35393 Transcript_25760/m.35393 type:complete len:723 (+) Transcript_25760:67-2235(+)